MTEASLVFFRCWACDHFFHVWQVGGARAHALCWTCSDAIPGGHAYWPINAGLVVAPYIRQLQALARGVP